MILSRSSRLAATGALAIAAFSGTAGVAAATTPASSSVPSCAGSNLRISLGRSDGAAGHGSYPLVFKNEARSACSLYGYPGLDAITAHGHLLDHAKRTPNPGHRAHTVILEPSGRASALVEFAVMSGSGECALAHHIATTPPNTKRTLLRTRPTYLCDLTIRPVVPGSTGLT